MTLSWLGAYTDGDGTKYHQRAISEDDSNVYLVQVVSSELVLLRVARLGEWQPPLEATFTAPEGHLADAIKRAQERAESVDEGFKNADR